MKFKDRVLYLTKKVPRGKITTYKLIAHKLGTKAYGAVGQALNKNQDPIKIPCNRVVSSDGSIGGYASGVKAKIKKLKQEGIEFENNTRKNQRFFVSQKSPISVKIKDFKKRLYKF